MPDPHPWIVRAVAWLALLLPMAASAQPAVPHAPDRLATLAPERPRLLTDADDFARVRELITTDPLAQRWHARLVRRAEAMLDEPVTRHHLRDGRRLLYESRAVKERVLTLALLYRVGPEPDPRYLARVRADVLAAAAFPDWNPSHFLDVAEMAFAFAIADDWLHDAWTPEERAAIRGALLRHAVEPGLRGYAANAWWTRTTNNWNQVCNAGLIAAALAVADDHPAPAAALIDHAVAALPISMARYAPDGGYDEGPGYWAYGTTYNVYAVAMLESALGDDAGLGGLPGFAQTGWFPVHLTGPTGDAFNFADALPSAVRAPIWFYLAQRAGDPALARHAVAVNRGEALDLLWYDPALLESNAESLPTGVSYTGVGVAALRSAWGDPDAWFLAAKGGTVDTGHAQLDLGSFILEARGVRWFVDLGGDDYHLPGYFHATADGRRWSYYRNRAEGHNTLVIDPPTEGPDQPVGVHAPIQLDGDTITIGLDDLAEPAWTRTLTLDGDAGRVRVVDTIAGGAPADVWWFAHTRATVTLDDDGRGATLTQDGQTLRAVLVEPADARFAVMPAQPLPASPNPDGQNPNDGSRKLNNAPGANFVPLGETPRYGDPDPTQAVRKLAVHLPAFNAGRVVVEFHTPEP